VTGPVLLDTGPLVAVLNRREAFHKWARRESATLSTPFLTCEAVLSEACFLMSGIKDAARAIMDLLARGLLEVPFQLKAEVEPVAALLRRYADLPISLADACLIRMSEQYAGSRVFTLDRHFNVYRKHGRQVIPAILPPER
jgi:uncharacterized protein